MKRIVKPIDKIRMLRLKEHIFLIKEIIEDKKELKEIINKLHKLYWYTDIQLENFCNRYKENLTVEDLYYIKSCK